MKIWTVTFNDDGSNPYSIVLLKEADADTAARLWIDAYRDDYKHLLEVENDWDYLTWREVYEWLRAQSGFLDTIVVEGHEIDDSILWNALKAAVPGRFGVLYDPDELLTMMDGWDDEYAFDTPETKKALEAWCIKEGPDFEDTWSQIMGDNCPTEDDAKKALDDD